MISGVAEIFDSSEEEELEDRRQPDERKGLFRKELSAMLYGFGDSKESDEKTVEALEKIVIEYIEKLCQKALAVGKPNRIALDDIYYLIRRDHKKFSRVKELLSMSEELKKARRAFDDAKEI